MRLPSIAELEIPQRSGDVVCVPPGPDLLELARTNAERLQNSRTRIGGVPLSEFRAQTRARLLTRAAEFTAAAGIPVAASSPGDLVVVTGHQPFFFHPGIWIKHLLVDRLAGMGAAGLSMAVDGDTFDEIGVDVPALDGRLRRVREILATAPSDVPYEAQPAPSDQAWEAFLARVGTTLSTLRHTDIPGAFAAFAQRSPTPGGQCIGEFITQARRRYEGPRRYLELPVSQMSDTEEFRRFILHILADAERFADIYNRRLRAYRQENNIRTTAQPFPDLGAAGDAAELPFWLVHGGRRLPLFGRRSGDAYRLMVGTTEVAALTRRVPEELEGLAIRPRAVTLTAFTRLCVADLFVHGIGGARYDRVTDAVIRDFFELEPPQYSVATATVHLPLAADDTAPELQHLRRRLLELQHNPERVLHAPSGEQRRLIEEKWKLIDDLERAPLSRKTRRHATQRIRQINETLSAALETERDAVERRLAALEDTHGSDTVAASRTYPFCFFSPQTMDELVSRQLEERVGGH